MIARGDGTVLYNFAVAVDDAEMGITDVVRGDDHLSNTPISAKGTSAPRRAASRCSSAGPASVAHSASQATRAAAASAESAAHAA